MTDERTDAGSKTTSPKSAEPDEDRSQAAYNEISALYNEFTRSETERYGITQRSPWVDLALIAAASIYSKAFLEALAKRHADGISDELNKRFRSKGLTTEFQVSVDGDASATVVVTRDLPDEARLALLDLDVTADELRGKVLRWDRATSAWRPDDDQ